MLLPLLFVSIFLSVVKQTLRLGVISKSKSKEM